MNLKHLLTACALIAPALSFAQATFEVNGIVYTEDLSDPSKLAVIVVKKTSPMLHEAVSAYEGDIVIPSTVEHDLDTYQVTGIAQGAFWSAEIESLVINDGPTKILTGTIYCPKLEKLVFPSTMTSITGISTGDALEELVLDDNIKTIENCSFSDAQISSIKLPANLKTLESTFTRNSELKEVVFNNNLKKLKGSFWDCGLVNANIPGSVKTIEFCFRNCNDLQSVTVNEGTTKIESSFDDCKNLAEINLPSTLTTINNSFDSLEKLTSLTIPDGVTSIEHSFSWCRNIKELRMGKGFADLKVFDNIELEKLYCPWTTVPELPNYVRYAKGLTVYVPKGCAAAYAEAWDLAKINRLKENVKIEEIDF